MIRALAPWYGRFQSLFFWIGRLSSRNEQRRTVLMFCKHCFYRRAIYGQHLCPECFQADEIRRQYVPRKPKTPRREPRGSYQLPPETQALPGTAEKIAVLTERAQSGVALFNPGDGRRG